MPRLSIQAAWHWTAGKLDGSDLIVYNDHVTEPIAVRHAYTSYPTRCDIYNSGRPACRTLHHLRILMTATLPFLPGSDRRNLRMVAGQLALAGVKR